jgi:hypothetical protein
MARPKKPKAQPDPNKPRRKHSAETIAKMSERRRARTVQPRSGTSKKRQNLYQELKHEYKNSPEALRWLEENKDKLNVSAEETRAWGIHTEYHQQYPGIYERTVGSILYGDKVDENGSGDEYTEIDAQIDSFLNGEW